MEKCGLDFIWARYFNTPKEHTRQVRDEADERFKAAFNYKNNIPTLSISQNIARYIIWK